MEAGTYFLSQPGLVFHFALTGFKFSSQQGRINYIKYTFCSNTAIISPSKEALEEPSSLSFLEEHH